MASNSPKGQELIDLAWKQPPIKVQGLAAILTGITVTLAILSLVVVSLRIFVRLWLQKSEKMWGWDDTLSVLSLITFLPECVYVVLAAQYGLGTRDDQLNDLVKAQASIYTGNWQMFYAASVNLVKAGIAMTLLRLTDRRMYRWQILAMLISIPVFTSCVILILIITCHPVGAQWDLDLGACPLHTWLAILSYPFTAMTIILDWGCAIIPWLLIRKLQMNRRIKTSLILILALGGVASVGAIARLPYLKYYSIGDDQLYHCANIVLWSVFENGIGIVAASLPPTRKLFRFYDDSIHRENFSRARASETIGGTPLDTITSPTRLGTHRLQPRTAKARRGPWDHMDAEGSSQEHIIVQPISSINK